MQKEKDFLKHLTTIGFGSLVSMALGFFTTPLITRVIDPAEFGKFDIYNSYMNIILSFCFLGLNHAILRFYYENKNKQQLLKLCFFIPVIVTMITFAIFILLKNCHVLNEILDYKLIIVLFISIMINIWNRYAMSILRLEYKSKIYSFCTVLEKLTYCFLILSFVLVIKKDDMYVLVLSTALAMMIPTILATIKTIKYWNFSGISFPDNSKEIMKYSVPFVFIGIFESLVDSTEKFRIDKLFGDYYTGIYGSALYLIAIFTSIKTIFNILWLPAQSEQFNDEKNGKQFIKKTSTYITFIMFFVGINVVLFKDVLIKFLGESYHSANEIVSLLFLGQIMLSISDTTCTGINYSKKSYLNIYIYGSALLVKLILNYYLINKFALYGAALSNCLTYTFIFIIKTLISNNYYFIDYKIKRIAILFVLLLSYCLVDIFVNNVVVMLICYAACMFVLLYLYKEELQELLSITRKKLIDK